MSKRSYFSQYESPNIVIVPTVSFCNASVRKKMRLGIESSSDEPKSKNDREEEKSETSCNKLENNCVLVKNIGTNCSENTNLRSKFLSNINFNKPKKSEIKLSRINIQSESSNEASKVNEYKVKPSTYKKVNLDQKMSKSDISEPSTSFKRDLGYKTPKNISRNKKYILTESLPKKSHNSVCNQINNTDRVPLKCTNKQYIPSSSRRDKTCSKRDDIIKDKIPRNLSTNKSKHYDTYIGSKVSKNRQNKSKKIMKQDYPDQNSKCKYTEQRSKKEEKCKKSKDKTPFNPEIENIYHKKHVTTQCFNVNDPIQDYKKNKTNKYKHESHVHNEEKNIHTSTSKNKELSDNKDTLTNKKKLTIQKESRTNKYNTKTINIKKYQDKDKKTKSKQIDTINKSQLKNNKHKLKLLKIDKNTKPSQEKRNTDNLFANCQESSNVCKNLKLTYETSNKKHERLGLPNTKKLTKPLRKKEIKLIINLVVKDSNNKHIQTITHDTSCAKTEDTKTPLLSNSELSFLDDINIDEIVDSLKQPKVETDAIQQEIRDPNRYAPIIISDDESDTEKTTVCNEIGGLNSSDKPVKIQKHNKPTEDEIICDGAVDLSHFNDRHFNSEQSALVPVVIKPTILKVEDITKQGVIEEKNKITSIDLTEVDDMVEALSDCSTVILDGLDESDIEICDDISEKNESLFVLKVNKTAQNVGIVCSKNQTEQIVSPKRTQETISLKDPIEAELNKMFEIDSSDTLDIDRSVRVNANSTKETLNTFIEEKPAVILLTSQTVKLVPGHHTSIEEKSDVLASAHQTEKLVPGHHTSIDEIPEVLGTAHQADKLISEHHTHLKEKPEILGTAHQTVKLVPGHHTSIEEKPEVSGSAHQTEKLVPGHHTSIEEKIKVLRSAHQTVKLIPGHHTSIEEKPEVLGTAHQTIKLVPGHHTSTEEKPEVLGSARQIEKLVPGHHIQCNSKDNANTDGQLKILNKTNITNTSTNTKRKTKVIESQKLPIDTRVSTPLKTVKSEVRKITKKNSLPLTQEDNIFIDALKSRVFLKSQYNVTSLIHKGKHSKIYQCKDCNGINYALKILNNTRDGYYCGIHKKNMIEDIQKDIPKEKLYCVYVINSFSMYGYWCFLMEYYPKTLLEALQENNKTFHIDTVNILAKQLIIAVTVIRNNNIVHSDIKPAHILINTKNDRIKLCGFDSAYYMKEGTMAPNIGTVNYRAPEVILGYSSGFSVDVWSTGLVMYEMATKIMLFPGLYNNDILYKQQCTLGGIPDDMLQKSIFKANHFYDTNFMRKIGFNREVIQFIYNFKRNKRIHRTLLDAYAHDWSEVRTKQEQTKDLAKIGDFQVLLEQMLVIHPKHRLSIEFVYANPFIYESEMSYS